MEKEILRDALHRGDPAAGEPGLSPEEVHAMRRAVLTAVPEPRRRRLLWIPTLATGLVVLALVVGLWLRQDVQPPAPPQVAAVPPTPPPPAPVDPVVAPPTPLEQAPGPVVAEKPVRRPRRSPPPASPPVDEPPVVLAQAEPETRQIQFSTPGGTRVIWMLSPDSAL